MKKDSNRQSAIEPLVSVVTPVYNGEKYLPECIESVLAQTSENWEYVIVNNCSSDRSLKIAQDYAEKDSRIRVHDNRDFLPMVENFNHSLLQVSPESKYCKVIHADDVLFPECISKMVALAEEKPSVGIVGSYVLEGCRVKCDGLPFPQTFFSGREICRCSLMGTSPVSGGLYVFGSPTSLLIRSDLIRSRKPFYNDKYLQVIDQEVCYYLLQNVDFGYVHQVLTHSRLHDESQTSSNEIMNRLILEKIMLLQEFKSVYLSSKEYERRLAQLTHMYYRFLADSVFHRRDKEFWNFHKKGMEQLELPLSWPRLIKATSKGFARRILYYLLHPRAMTHRRSR